MQHSARKAAHGLAALGRGEDSMLVHMTPREVAGLQKIAMDHGGSLTINPHTGLPEAGFLKSILPMIAGVGLSFLAPGLSPWLIGGITGLGAKATGASTTEALLAGLSGGMAGNAAGKLAALGAKGAAGAGAGALNTAANQAAVNAAYGTAAKQGLGSYLGSIGTGLGQLGTEAGSKAAMSALGGKLGLGAIAAPALYQAAKPPKYKAPELAKESNFRYYKTKYRPGQYNPNAGFGEPMFTGQGYDEGQYYDKYPGYAEGGEVPAPQQDMQAYYQSLLAPPAPASAGPSAAIMDYISKVNTSLMPKAPAAPTTPAAPAAPTTPATPAIPGMPAGFDPSKLGSFMGVNFANLMGGMGGTGGSKYTYDPATQRFTTAAVQPAGKKKKGNSYAAGGRLLSGGGDGMSDSIPAMIEGPKPQQARLADGEFVIPADVVSHLGNGSTKAGAGQLYAMMDKVRQARTGQTKQAPAINPNKYLA